MPDAAPRTGKIGQRRRRTRALLASVGLLPEDYDRIVSLEERDALGLHGLLPPAVETRATDNLAAMQAMIEELLDQGKHGMAVMRTRRLVTWP